MLPRKLYRGDAQSVAEQVLRDALIVQRDKLIRDMADFVLFPGDNSVQLLEFVSRARVLIGMEDETASIVAQHNKVNKEK